MIHSFVGVFCTGTFIRESSRSSLETRSGMINVENIWEGSVHDHGDTLL